MYISFLTALSTSTLILFMTEVGKGYHCLEEAEVCFQNAHSINAMVIVKRNSWHYAIILYHILLFLRAYTDLAVTLNDMPYDYFCYRTCIVLCYLLWLTLFSYFFTNWYNHCNNLIFVQFFLIFPCIFVCSYIIIIIIYVKVLLLLWCHFHYVYRSTHAEALYI